MRDARASLCFPRTLAQHHNSCALSLVKMKMMNCDEVVLETETTNTAAIQLYLKLGFFKDKRLERYYLNGGDAFRLKMWFR
jgi:peptide alpha-N-acetyltransferase